MPKTVFLDSGPLGRVAHAKANPKATAWLQNLLAAGINVVIPEIADYEVRRELLRAGLARSVRHLDKLKQVMTYLPITTDAMLKAAELWAQARKMGQPTADDKALDGDVILAGQAATSTDETDVVVIATENVGHLSRFAPAKRWEEIR